MMSEGLAAVDFLNQQMASPPADAAALPWLARLRHEGRARFESLGLPHPKAEDWKFTNLQRALQGLQLHAPATTPGALSLDRVPELLDTAQPRCRLVFTDGRLHPELGLGGGLPDGVRLAPLSQLLRESPDLLAERLGALTAAGEDQPLLALNDALFEEGAVLLLDDGVELAQTVELVFLNGLDERPAARHPRLVVALGAGARARLVERHQGLGETAGLTNMVSEIALGRGAKLTHLRLQDEATTAFHLATSHVAVAADADYEAFAMTCGAALSRHEVRLRLAGEGATARLDGIYLLTDRQHADTTTLIEHWAPHTTSREVYKGALDGRSRGVFQGRIHVLPDAQQSDGRMLNKTLLLSDTAEIDSKPELEIYADDVQCAHGATAGEIDHDALFYLRSRGLTEGQARSLLVEAFLAEAVDGFADDGLRPALLARLRHWLSQR